MKCSRVSRLGFSCDFCHPNDRVNRLNYSCKGCEVVKELPFINNQISHLVCANCPNVFKIPKMNNLNSLDCTGCSNITSIPYLPNLSRIVLDDCVLLVNSGLNCKQKLQNAKSLEISCDNCPLLHFNPTLFIKFNGFDKIGSSTYLKDTRPRNGVSPRLFAAFSLLKKLFCYELPSRVALEVSLNSIMYAPGGLKYLELARKYNHVSDKVETDIVSKFVPVDYESFFSELADLKARILSYMHLFERSLISNFTDARLKQANFYQDSVYSFDESLDKQVQCLSNRLK